jgi:hypothetical protein
MRALSSSVDSLSLSGPGRTVNSRGVVQGISDKCCWEKTPSSPGTLDEKIQGHYMLLHEGAAAAAARSPLLVGARRLVAFAFESTSSQGQGSAKDVAYFGQDSTSRQPQRPHPCTLGRSARPMQCRSIHGPPNSRFPSSEVLMRDRGRRREDGREGG